MRCFFIGLFISLASLSVAQTVYDARFQFLPTRSSNSSFGFYNPANNKMMYYGLVKDEANEHAESRISVKDLGSGEETILEKNQPHGLGWIDSTSVLIYLPRKEGPSQDKSNPALIKYNIKTKETQEVKGLPLRQVRTSISVHYPFIFYQVRYAKPHKICSYNLLTDSIYEYKTLEGKDVNHLNFSYSHQLGIFAYVEGNSKIHTLKYIKDGKTETIKTFPTYCEIKSFSASGNKLFYVYTREKTPGSITQPPSYNEELYMYDFISGKSTLQYVFNDGFNCLQVSPVTESRVIISLGFPSNEFVKFVPKAEQGRPTFFSGVQQHLFYFDLK